MLRNRLTLLQHHQRTTAHPEIHIRWTLLIYNSSNVLVNSTDTKVQITSEVLLIYLVWTAKIERVEFIDCGVSH